MNVAAGGPLFLWINLDSATQRADRLLGQFAGRGIRNTRIPAMDGREVSVDHYCRMKWSPTQTEAKELATVVSHLKAMLWLVRHTNEPMAVICEDDVSFELEDRWPCPLDELLKRAPSRCQMLQLGVTVTEVETLAHLKGQVSPPWVYAPRHPRYFGAFSYAITRKCAARFLRKYRVREKKGEILSAYRAPRHRHQVDKELFQSGRNVYTVLPPFFTYPSANDSTIHPEQLETHSRSKRWLLEAIYG